MKRLAIVVGAGLSVLVVSLAAFAAIREVSPAGTPIGSVPAGVSQVGEDDAGVHGGPIERFHGGASCDLTTIGGLPGNWTHGDYVSAVAESGDATLIQQAAHSDCGKPMVAVNHGGAPPAHALENRERAQEHAEEAAEHTPVETPVGS